MKSEGEAKQVTIFLNSDDQWFGNPLHSAIVQRCHKMGIAVANATICSEGYGANRQLHPYRLPVWPYLHLLADLPVRIDIVDVAERIDPLLVELEEMIDKGLITIANVHFLSFGSERQG